MKIRFLSTYPHSIAFGGQEVVQETLVRELRLLRPDWDIGFLAPESREPLADAYQLIGNSAALAFVVRFIPQDVPVVVSVIDGVRKDSRVKRTLKKCVTAVTRLIGEETSYSHLSYLFRRADRVLALHEPAAEFSMSRYGVPRERLHIVPNGASPDFFERPEVDGSGILVSGSMISRKQPDKVLDFAQSHFGHRYSFHFVGATQNNELAYGNSCIERIMELPNCHYHGFLAQGGDEFWTVFDKCRFFLQLSLEETQSLSALEAIAGGKRCVFRRAAYSSLPPFDRFPSVIDGSPEDINQALEHSEAQTVERGSVKSWPEIAKQLLEIYLDLNAQNRGYSTQL